MEVLVKNDEVLPHILFDGPPGVGKTCLASILANEAVTDIQIANGSSVRSIKTLLPYLMKIKEGTILFIDEIHRLTTLTSEFLYPVMEDFRVDLGKEKETITINLPKFSLIGATTEGGSLTRPLFDRFQHKFYLDIYEVTDLVVLLKQSSLTLNVDISEAALIMIGERARGTPRIANNLLEWTKKVMGSLHRYEIDSDMVDKAMNMIGIDKDGLDKNDRKYLGFLKRQTKPMGLNTLVASLDICRDTLEQVIEPFLLRKKLMIKTGKGRMKI